ncbi:tetratricopeptide repeat protein [Streptomyces sp. NPDC054866]
MGPQNDPTDAEQACTRGELSQTRHDVEAAERDFLAALALIGDGTDGAALRARAHVGLGRLRLAAGEAEEGAVEFGRAHELRPDASEPLHWLGCAAAHRAAYESADEHFTAALNCASPHRRSRIQRAYVRVRLRRYEDALDDLRRAGEEGALDAEARWVMTALSGGGAGGELALLLRKAALAGLRVGGERRTRAEVDRRGWAVELGERGEQSTQVEVGEQATPGDAGKRAEPDGPGKQAELGGSGEQVQPGGPGGHGGGFGAGVGLVGVGWGARVVEASLSLLGPGEVEGEFVPLYAVLLVLGGRREAAVALLEGAARRDPADHRITHTLALALLNSPGEQGWERCVAAWGALLHDDAFWEHRRASAGARFGVPVEAALDAGLRGDLRELIERRMPEGDAGDRVPPGALLQREADAARILAAVGGFPAGRGGEPLVGGPLRIAGLGLVDEFGSFAAAAPETVVAESQLAYAFSELGFAQLLLKQGKPAAALAALTELRCPSCRERSEAAAAICEPDCGRFDALNPAYAGHPDKHHRLARDARGLALRARLDLGSSQLTAAHPDFRAAAASWRRALVHGRELERYRETQAVVVNLALGAARAAHRAGDPTRAVDTLEAVRAITGANERGRLEGQLARLLADRGISAANRDGTFLDAPAADLRRSVAFNPHLLRAQISLGVVLRGLAARRWRSGSVSGARAALREALDQLDAALTHFPGDPELTEQRDAALADLDHVAAERQEAERQAAGRQEVEPQESGR